MAPATWQFRVEEKRGETAHIFRLSGRLAEASAHLLRETLDRPEGIGVVVDLSTLNYISGAGLDVLDQAAHLAVSRGQPFVLCGLEGSVRIAFQLAGLLDRLRVEANVERALAIAAAHSPPSARRES